MSTPPSYNSSQTISNFLNVYISWFSFALGFVAVFVNGFLLFILTYFPENRRHTTNRLIINQTLMDLWASVALIISFGPMESFQKQRHFSDESSLGIVLCDIFYSTILLYTAVVASVIGLTIIAFERYVKICHSMMHRKYYRLWMIYVMLAYPWISGLIGSSNFICLPTTVTVILDGQCMPLVTL